MAAWLRHLNYAPPGAGYARAWGAEIYHPSFDRWLYLVLNRLGLQGRVSRQVIEAAIKPGDLAVDVGGNVGLYTVLLSRCVGPQGSVLTFEPVPVLQDALRRTVARNGLMNVEIGAHALGATTETVRLTLDPFNSGNNWLTHEPGSAQGPLVQVRSLDETPLRRPPAFIKIDVQGWEVEVLRGMKRILSGTPPPILYCEVSESALRTAGSSAVELGRLLTEVGYTLAVATARGPGFELQPLGLDELSERAARVLYFDILAVPAGRTAAEITGAITP